MGNIEHNKYMVCVSCMTYNHNPYIEDALNGFCMQQTTFPFVCTIIDDASTDGEQEVIKSYLYQHFDLADKSIVRNEETDDYILTFARHKTNLNCFFVVLYLKYNHYSIKKTKIPYVAEWRNNCKYIALCEGDDYWTDHYKLQQQVSFMESHPNYSMCFHNAIEHWEKNEQKDCLFSDIQDRDYCGLEIYEKWIVPTGSVLTKNDVWKSDLYKEAVNNPNFIYGDIVLFLTSAALGKVRGMRCCMSVYRRHEGGVAFSMDTNHLVRRTYHHYAIHKVFGNIYKKLSIERYTDDSLLSVSRLRAENKAYMSILLKVLCISPIKTLKYIFKVPLAKIGL